MGEADLRNARDLDKNAACHGVDRNRRAGREARSNRDDVVPPVAVDIGDARRQILEDLLGGKRNLMTKAGIVHDDEAAAFDIVAEDGVVVAWRRRGVPRLHDPAAGCGGDGAVGNAVARRHGIGRTPARDADRIGAGLDDVPSAGADEDLVADLAHLGHRWGVDNGDGPGIRLRVRARRPDRDAR